MEAAADTELFGTLRLVRGGKHGHAGVRGGQGKKRDKFQAYCTIDRKKITVPGLHMTPHTAAVALAQWKLNYDLGFEDEEPHEKKPRKKRGLKAAEQTATAAATSELLNCQRVPLQPVGLIPPFPALVPAIPRAAAHPLPQSGPMAAFGVPIVRAHHLYRP